jgi:hypothetical protein
MNTSGSQLCQLVAGGKFVLWIYGFFEIGDDTVIRAKVAFADLLLSRRFAAHRCGRGRAGWRRSLTLLGMGFVGQELDSLLARRPCGF